MTRIIRRNRLLAAAALLGLLGAAGMSAPAAAQAPQISTLDCKVFYKDLPSLNVLHYYRCGPLEVELERRLVVTCGGPGQCWANVTDYLRARRISFPGFTVLAYNVLGMNPPNTAN